MNSNNGTLQVEQHENSFHTLYEEAKLMWRGVVFEILLEPLDPRSGEIAERHIIDFRSCKHDTNKPRNVDGLLPLNELADELPDYNKLLESSNQAITLIKEEYKDRYKVTLLRVLHQQIRYEEESDSEHEAEEEYESEPEYEGYSTDSEVETDSDEPESEPEWEEEWESDSGRETELDQSIGSPAESEVEYESDWEIDSGRQSESESEWGQDSDVEELHYEEESDPSYEGLSSGDDDEDCYEEYPQLVFPYADILIIGPNETRVSRWDFEAIPWDCPVEATKALLSLIFGEYILAISSLFRIALPEVQAPAREEHQLNPQNIEDIVGLISKHYKISQQEVLSIIQNKCAEARNVYVENVLSN